MTLLRGLYTWMAVSFLLGGLAAGLIFASCILAATEIRLADGYYCGPVAELAIAPADEPGGEQSEAFVKETTTGCDRAAVPSTTSLAILVWAGTGVTLAAIGSIVVTRRKIAASAEAVV